MEKHIASGIKPQRPLKALYQDKTVYYCNLFIYFLLFLTAQNKCSAQAAFSLPSMNTLLLRCLTLVRSGLCSSEEATLSVMTTVRAQHKESCQGNLYELKCQILSG